MKRPFLMVTLCTAGGITFADFVPLSLALLFVACFATAGATFLWPRARSWLMWPLLALTGMTGLTLQQSVLSPCDLRVLLGDRIQYATFRGLLRETPYQRVYEHRGEESWHTVAIVEATSMRVNDAHWIPLHGDLAVSTSGLLPGDFFGGRGVEVTGVVRSPRGPTAEGLFDYRRYLGRLGIHYQLQVSSSNDWRVLGGPVATPVADRFRAWAQMMLARGLPEVDEPLRLLWAMTLGWKTALTDEVSEPFMRSGTMHIFAISGLHIALIAGIFVSLFRVFTVPRGACGLVVIPLIWAYTGVTGWQASAIRSTIMMTVIIAGWSLKRPSDLINSLAAAAWIILLWDPQQLFQPSFQLSFSVVLSLALFLPVLEGLRKRWLAPDPFLPAPLRPHWPRWAEVPARHAATSFTTSLAAWLGSMPLVAYYFHLFTPVSLIANLIVVPLSGLALMSNLASLVVGAAWPVGAELFNHSAWFWMQLMVSCSEGCAYFPGAACYVAAPGPITFFLYYSLLVGAMSGWLSDRRYRRWAWTGLALVSSVWILGWWQDRSQIQLDILPLNGGAAAFLETPGQGRWLIDCGNLSAAEFVTKPFLQARGINRLPHLVLTHGDTHHVGGTDLIREKFSVGQVLFSPIQFRSSAYRKLRAELEAIPNLTKTVQRGDRLGPWTVLHPGKETRFPRADDNAIVLAGNFRGTRVLLLSDLGKPGQNALLQNNPDLRADIVVAGLPQQSEPLADAVIETLQPRLIIITDAEYPAQERASAKLRKRLGEHGIPVLYTRETEGISLTFSEQKWRVKTMKEPSPSDPSLLSNLTPDASALPTRSEPGE